MLFVDKDSSSPLSVDHVSIMPSKFIVPAQQMKEFQIVYHANQADEDRCKSYPAPLACLRLTTGDEVLRQRLQKVVTQRFLSSLVSQHQERGATSRLKNASNEAFLTHFHEQETVPTG